jgi:hypothetical protein
MQTDDFGTVATLVNLVCKLNDAEWLEPRLNLKQSSIIGPVADAVKQFSPFIQARVAADSCLVSSSASCDRTIYTRIWNARLFFGKWLTLRHRV